MIYVGRTKRAMHIRIKEHVCQIVKGKKEKYLYHHFRTVHNKKVLGIMFWGLEKYKNIGGVVIVLGHLAKGGGYMNWAL